MDSRAGRLDNRRKTLLQNPPENDGRPDTLPDRERRLSRVGNGPLGSIAAVEEQIEKLRGIRRRWADGGGLTGDQKSKRELTLGLLDDAIRDLIRRREELLRSGE